MVSLLVKFFTYRKIVFIRIQNCNYFDLHGMTDVRHGSFIASEQNTDTNITHVHIHVTRARASFVHIHNNIPLHDNTMKNTMAT